jgi:hypothetical protein
MYLLRIEGQDRLGLFVLRLHWEKAQGGRARDPSATTYESEDLEHPPRKKGEKRIDPKCEHSNL